MAGSIYISDPSQWRTFYENMSEKKFNPYDYARKRNGKYTSYKKSFLIPVNRHAESQSVMQQVTPIASVIDRAKENLKRERIDDLPHVKVTPSTKRKRNQSSSRINGNEPIKKHAKSPTPRKRGRATKSPPEKKRRVQSVNRKRKLKDIWSTS